MLQKEDGTCLPCPETPCSFRDKTKTKQRLNSYRLLGKALKLDDLYYVTLYMHIIVRYPALGEQEGKELKKSMVEKVFVQKVFLPIYALIVKESETVFPQNSDRLGSTPEHSICHCVETSFYFREELLLDSREDFTDCKNRLHL